MILIFQKRHLELCLVGKKMAKYNCIHRIKVLREYILIYTLYFSEGYINWNVFQEAIAKIKTNRNGSWMFEQQHKKEEEKY
jgi:hypothetical protein